MYHAHTVNTSVVVSIYVVHRYSVQLALFEIVSHSMFPIQKAQGSDCALLFIGGVEVNQMYICQTKRFVLEFFILVKPEHTV